MNLSHESLSLLAQWQRTDRKFFRKHSADPKAMEIVAALAEMIATYEAQVRKPTPFYC
jgi:hypothetical protein